MAVFNIDALKAGLHSSNRYERRIAQLVREGRYVESIKATVETASANVGSGSRSFVIYGEPQSGKTEMMIALTARLLDSGHRIVVVLLNDNVQLLIQNLSRFRNAGLDPAPQTFDEVLHDEIDLRHGEWVIFCKKNSHDLQKLNEKLRRVKDAVVVIDDEADYATPNAKINSGMRTKINELVEQLLGPTGLYVGVTATPARLNLNNTFNNDTERWVLFPPHPLYVGHPTFFPTTVDKSALPFNLQLLPDASDIPKYIREAIFRFLTNVAYLNTQVNSVEENYSMLIHTSGIRADHTKDYKEVLRTFEILSDPKNKLFNKYYESIWNIANKNFPGIADVVTEYVMKNARRRVVVVMNSNGKNNNYDPATTPTAPFTLAIGGNIVSRGVTFNNLLSMFFSRDVKHKIQQDTYIQRARMFGSRLPYLRHFELSIPESLYLAWHRCFLFHTLALAAIQTEGRSPVWLEDTRIASVAANSINRATVSIDSGEMSFEIFRYDAATLTPIISELSLPIMERLSRLQSAIGGNSLPSYLIDFIRGFCPNGDRDVAIHEATSIEGYADSEGFDRKLITRKRGFMGTNQTVNKAPDAIHHFKVFFNGAGNARLFYKFTGNVRFLKSSVFRIAN